MGNDISLGPARFVVVCPLDGLRQQFKKLFFLYFNLKQKAIELNNVGHI